MKEVRGWRKLVPSVRWVIEGGRPFKGWSKEPPKVREVIEEGRPRRGELNSSTMVTWEA